MSNNQGVESWFEGMGLYPFPMNESTAETEKKVGKLDTLLMGMKKRYVDSRIARISEVATALLPKDSSVSFADYELKDGGTVLVTDMSFEGEWALGVRYQSQMNEDAEIVAYFEAIETATPLASSRVSCNVRMGEFGTAGYKEFDTNNSEFLYQSFHDIRNDISIISSAVDRASLVAPRND